MTDNYKGFPARMNDGRFMTEYKPSCLLNKNIMSTMNMDSNQYRQYLITSATDIMNKINTHNMEMYGCTDCSKVTVPEAKNFQDCWDSNCKIENVNPTGLGIDQVNGSR